MPSPEHDSMVALLVAQRAGEEGQSEPAPSLEERRLAYEGVMALFPLPEGLRVEPVDAGGVPAERLTFPGTASDESPVVLYLHGGGFCIGSARTHRDLAARIAQAAGGEAIALDYRLAPEHPFPAAVDDALAAWRWLLREVDPRRAVVAGDSAGGGLALLLALAARDAGLPVPAGVACLSPWTDLTLSGDSMNGAAEDPILSLGDVVGLRDAYLAGADPRQPLASPLFADLAGMPPVTIHVGTAELVLDDSRRIAAALPACELVEWPDLVHVFPHVAPHAPESVACLSAIGDFARRVTGAGSQGEVAGLSAPGR